MTASVQPEDPQHRRIRTEDLTLGLLERIRILLRGGSVVDWYQLGFESREEVRDFIRVNGFQPETEEDVVRLRELYRMASVYLTQELGIQVVPELSDPAQIEDPLLIASQPDHPAQRQACILLKVVHTVHHFQARELRMNLALSEVEVFALAEMRVERGVRSMIRAGYPIVEFASSRKSNESTITKLLSKRRATAAQILDRLRFRVVVSKGSDVPVVLAAMTQKLLPFNYVIPEESTNRIVNFVNYSRSLPHLKESLNQLQFGLSLEDKSPIIPEINECSADAFRMFNFVVDLPVRLGAALQRPEHLRIQNLGRVVFLKVEFQMFDENSWRQNETDPETNHLAYKNRQRDRVRKRLEDGLDGNL